MFSACRMGDISSVLVPRHSFVRIPRYEEKKTNDQCFKYQTCVCGQHNRLNNCKPILCTRRESCFLGQNPVVKGNKMEYQNTTILEQFWKNIERGKNYTFNPRRHDYSHSWLGTDISIKSGRVKSSFMRLVQNH